MANILVTYTAFVVDGQYVDTCFFEGFLRDLSNNGNRVMRLRTNELVDSSWNGSNKVNRFINREKLFDDIKSFNPDLVITFNNSCLEGLDRELNCPFLVMEADRFIYYSDKEYLKENSDRFFFSNTTEKTLNDTWQSLGAPNQFKGFVLPFATSLKSSPSVDQDINISFIGNCFTSSYELVEKFDRHSGKTNFFDGLSDAEKVMVDSARTRISVLNELADLGLQVYGPSVWKDLKYFFLQLAASYQDQAIYSLADNQQIYNRSKLCVNINHSQAIDGYSFRVMDVMASNALLFSSESAGIRELTKGYVDIPFFDSASDARELAMTLLKDPIHRSELVAGSQKCIEEKGRWEQRFSIMQSEIGVEVLSNGSQGELFLVDEEDYFSGSKKSFDSLQKVSVHLVPTAFYPLIKKIMRKFKILPDKSAVSIAKKRLASK